MFTVPNPVLFKATYHPWLVGLFVTFIVIVELYDVFDDALQPSLFPFDHVANRQLPQFLKVADLPNRCEPHGRAGL
jgi:hypothetical protein